MKSYSNSMYVCMYVRMHAYIHIYVCKHSVNIYVLYYTHQTYINKCKRSSRKNEKIFLYRKLFFISIFPPSPHILSIFKSSISFNSIFKRRTISTGMSRQHVLIGNVKLNLTEAHIMDGLASLNFSRTLQHVF